MSEKASLVLSSGSTIHVEGIGPSKARSLLEWRKSAERKYINKMPISVPQTEIHTIKSKYQTKRNNLQSQEQTLKNNAQQKKNATRTKYANENYILQREIDGVRLNVKNNQQKMDLELSGKTKEISVKQWEDAQIQRELNRYQKISYLRFLRALFLFQK